MYDLIIIGGGPSGSQAGRCAGKEGLKTLLIEKDRFPRSKPCGGALSEKARSYLDFELPPEICEKEIFGARLRFRDQIIEGSRDFRLATMITRRSFDNYLLEKAAETGIEIQTGERVTDFEEREDHVEVHTKAETFRSRFLIVSEGAQGKLKHRIRKRDRSKEYGICLVADIEEDNEKIDDFLPGILEIHFGLIHMGYGWIFPHDGYYSVGIGSFARKWPETKRLMSDFLEKNGFTGKYRVRGHLIPAGGIRRKNVGRRVILTGDAAGFVDPFSGEGIAYAVRSGQIAGAVVAEIAAKGKALSTLKDYEKICENEFERNLRYALVTAKLTHRFSNLIYRVMRNNTESFDKFLEIQTLKRHYLSYLRWLIPRIPKYFLINNRR
ncbi:MAG: geranylgeranyl reductase family protein [Deltaproteobacteria bacterium]|mgnify:CR=1 FL=1|nr:geranylgeranyl reductase family protein [Deltaproteobacteria bacterium]MBN2845506.1 geranylgeranyl reductase family protein [Deltaproteobacteria bacterium]